MCAAKSTSVRSNRLREQSPYLRLHTNWQLSFEFRGGYTQIPEAPPVMASLVESHQYALMLGYQSSHHPPLRVREDYTDINMIGGILHRKCGVIFGRPLR